MMPVVSSLRRNLKHGLRAAFNLPFADEAHWLSGAGRKGHRLAGTSQNWNWLAGDSWDTPAAMAVYRWIISNYLQAPLMVQRLDGGEWATVQAHPLVKLLNRPNPGYDSGSFWGSMLISYLDDGNAYSGIEFDRLNRPAELWWCNHKAITPRRERDSRKWIDYYQRTTVNGMYPIPEERMLHVRFGIDPVDPLRGLSIIGAGRRSLYTLGEGENFGAVSMKNGGVPMALATPDRSKPEYNTFKFDTEAFSRLYSDQTMGDRRGTVLAYDAPINLTWPDVKPGDMALDAIMDRPESNICALLGVPPQVVGLHAGRLAKTYANYAEAREAGWEECIIPLLQMVTAQVGAKLLPHYGIPEDHIGVHWRLWFDTSDIRPLQPDLDKLHKRAREDWKAKLIDRWTWKMIVGSVPDEEDKGVYYSGGLAEDKGEDDKEDEMDRVKVNAKAGSDDDD